MKFGIKGLILWYLFFYFIIAGTLRDYFIYGTTDTFQFDSIFAFTGILVFFLYVLFTYSILYKFYPQGKWVHCLSGILFAFLAIIGTRYLIEQVITDKLFDATNYNPNYGVRDYIVDNYFFGIRHVTFATIYYFIRYSMYKQGREKDLILEKQEMEIKNLNAQVNPHFLLNSINNIYSLVYHGSDMALPALDKLSDILKYNLYENAEFVSIKKELDIVDQFVGLQKLRYDFPVKIQIESPKNDELKIPHLLILPIIENAFKHGVLNDPDNPIHLSIENTDSQIVIMSKNKKTKAQLKDKIGGIGLANIKNRLNLLYEGNTSFQINEDEDYFSMQLTLARID